jgi:hypothetical protein
MKDLVMIMKIIERDGDVIAGMGDVDLTVIVIKPMLRIAVELIVVNPYIVRALNHDAIVADDFDYDQVANDNIGFPNNSEATTVDDSQGTNAND